ncbi:type II toxin-antitoxin system VapC family toxin [Dyadobacter sp. CY356]|uniref:type II toxin-antitoxin system VapC family toxin n=1 Tax=Dyadobacter sp. CY356 TaxID=2906442 RepID=UPI001F23153B|nr:type II toxin-antitoxin system VapC family toxin [Dyadobacter sp. CY356]MCF0056512.1 type II toxin-antitoxin system VapC family toxin [Dyadobacter sp. CY356]
MNGSRVLIDTNIALYLFKGDKNLGSILQDVETYASFINELELLGFKGITLKEETWVELFLEECIIVDINAGIKEITKQIRRNYSLKLPDAIIAATAIFLGVPLLSADKQFGQVSGLTFVLYEP